MRGKKRRERGFLSHVSTLHRKIPFSPELFFKNLQNAQCQTPPNSLSSIWILLTPAYPFFCFTRRGRLRRLNAPGLTEVRQPMRALIGRSDWCWWDAHSTGGARLDWPPPLKYKKKKNGLGEPHSMNIDPVCSGLQKRSRDEGERKFRRLKQRRENLPDQLFSSRVRARAWQKERGKRRRAVATATVSLCWWQLWKRWKGGGVSNSPRSAETSPK